MKKGIVVLVVLAGLMIGQVARGDVVFSDDFENDPFVASGNPQDWSIFGTPIADKGTLNNSDYHSATAAVWVAVSWTGWGWGTTTISNEATRYNVVSDAAELSGWFNATNDFGAASIAMTIYDADGTQWRTADADLYQPGTSWEKFSSPLSNMVVETAGSQAGLDYTNITHFGFLAFTAGQTGQNQLHYDDFSVTAIPEPQLIALFGLGGLLLVRVLRSRKRG